VEIRVRFIAKADILEPGLYIGVHTIENQRIAGLDFRDFETAPLIRTGETAEMGFHLRELPLLPGDYELEVHLKDMAAHRIEVVPRSFRFQVVETPVYGGRKLDTWFGHVGLNAFPTLSLTTTSTKSPKVAAFE
jgi:hypothetical protein